MVVVGQLLHPRPEAGLDYARRLKILAEELSDTLYIVMRVYFENRVLPRVGKVLSTIPIWMTRLISIRGMQKARQFLLMLTNWACPPQTEALDPIAPRYYGDLIARPRLARAQLSHKPTARWRPAYPRRLALKCHGWFTRRCGERYFVRVCAAQFLWASTKEAKPPSSARVAMPTHTPCAAAVVVRMPTTPYPYHWQKKH